jgi:2-aminoethylphosphonate-pyruvate transaminase
MILGQEPILLTPGPLTTSPATKQAMLRDWGSWDASFNAITGTICRDLVDIVHGAGTHVCVPLQGSGTFSVEAALANLVPRTGKVLVPQNGAYCQRILKILKYLGRAHVALDLPEDQYPTGEMVEKALAADPAITHVAQVHCETGTGILNPLPDIAAACARRGVGLIVDAMSSFGAIDIDVSKVPVDAVVAASGKCIEGVPGMGFVIAKRDVLEKSQGNSHSLAMDLHDQWTYMQRTTQWRFTPPTHVVAAFRVALDQFLAEGGQPARGARYAKNCAGRPGLLVQGFLRAREVARLRALPGQAHAGGDLPRGLHRRHRRQRDEERGLRDSANARGHGRA